MYSFTEFTFHYFSAWTLVRMELGEKAVPRHATARTAQNARTKTAAAHVRRDGEANCVTKDSVPTVSTDRSATKSANASTKTQKCN